MTGLLDWIKTPEGQGLLSGIASYAANARRGAPINSIGSGLLGGVAGYSGALDRQDQTSYKNLQMDALRQQIAAKKRQDDWIAGMTGDAQPASMGNASAALGAGAQAGSVGPTMANAQRLSTLEPMSTPNTPTTIRGIPRDAFMADLALNAGKNLPEWMFKRMTPDMQVAGGYAFDKNNLQPGFMPGVNTSANGQTSVTMPDGKGGVRVSAPAGALDTFAQYQIAGELPKAVIGAAGRVNLRKNPDGTETPVSEASENPFFSQLLGQYGLGGAPTQPAAPQAPQATPQPGARPSVRAMPGDADRYAILTQELARAQTSGNAADVAAITREIQALPASARTGPSPSGLAVAGPRYGMTTQQAADAERARAQAQAEGRGAGERTTSNVERSDKASDMVVNLKRARTLLGMGPTESSIGAVRDKVAGAFGISTDYSQSANALETLSGWLVSNVPRMQGPQSNFDVQNYTTMAGKIGDRTLPIKDRLAALDEVERIHNKYAGLNAQPEQPAAPKNVVQQLPTNVPKGSRARDLATDQIMVFDGMRWKPEGK